MKRISERTVELVQQLYKVSGWLPWQRTGAHEKVRTIEKVAASEEAMAILPLLSQLFDSSSEVIDAAADAVARLVATCPPEDLYELDGQLRWQSEWDVGPQWLFLLSREIGNLPKPKQSQAAILGLASFHGDGYVRQTAVRLLDGVSDGSELPFLLIRMNDWVGAVQQDAQRAVERRLESGPFDLFVRNLYYVLRLLEQQRSDHSHFVHAVVRKLTQVEHQAVLLETLNNSDPFVRRAVFRLAVGTPGEHVARLVTAGFRSEDPILRLWAVREAPAVFENAELADLLRLSEDDVFMPVRRETLRARIERFPHEAEQVLNTALLDRSPAVREEGRFHLRKRGLADCSEFYRTALQDNVHIELAIAGLGETGTKVDAPLALPLLKADRARLRRAAVRTIGRLAPKQHVECLIERLTDDSPRVALEAARALRECTQFADADELWAIFRSDSRRHVKLAVYQLLDQLSAWRKLPYLIRAASDSNERIAARALTSISGMYYRVFTRPSAEDKQKIQKAIDEMAGALKPSFGTELQKWLDTMAK